MHLTTFATIFFVIIVALIVFTPLVSANAVIGVADGRGTTTIPITVSNSSNVGAMDVYLNFNPRVMRVGGVSNGDMDSMVANTQGVSKGVVHVIAYQTMNDGISDIFDVARLSVYPVGVEGTTCDLCIGVRTFKDASRACSAMDYTVCNGTYTAHYERRSSSRDGTYPPAVSDDSAYDDQNISACNKSSVVNMSETCNVVPANGTVYKDIGETFIRGGVSFLDAIVLVLLAALVFIGIENYKNGRIK